MEEKEGRRNPSGNNFHRPSRGYFIKGISYVRGWLRPIPPRVGEGYWTYSSSFSSSSFLPDSGGASLKRGEKGIVPPAT